MARRVGFNPKVAVREQRQTSSLNWVTLREYETDLASVSHSRMPAEAQSAVAAALSAAAGVAESGVGGGGGGGGGGGRGDSGGRALDRVGALAEGGLLSPAAVSLRAAPAREGGRRERAEPPPPPPPKVIEDWHVKRDACIYQGAEHSSAIVKVEGGVLVTTRSGNQYVLGRLDPAVADIVALVAPGAFNATDPLAPGTQKLLLFAESLAFGPHAAHVRALRESLAGLEGFFAAEGNAEYVAHTFESVRQALLGLGVRA